MWQYYFSARTKQEVLDRLAIQSNHLKIISGGTDLLLEMQQGLRPDTDTLIDISRIPEFSYIKLDSENNIHIGATATHTDVVGSALLRERAMPLVQACWSVGSPQIRNRGTVVGNLVTASPANDTIPPLMAMKASVVLQSKHEQRIVSLKDFYIGVRKTILKPDEMVTEVIFPALQRGQKGYFIKQGLRRAQAISVTNVTVLLTLNKGVVESAAITLGAVAPIVCHATEAEEWLVGKPIDEDTANIAGELATHSAFPISDLRASSDYRCLIVKALTKRAIEHIISVDSNGNVPNKPVLMRDERDILELPDGGYFHDRKTPIVTTINGQEYHLSGGANGTLIKLLREQAKLAGAKESCGEGECGACTVILDGALVNSCLVPAPRAHGAQILTVEGLAEDDHLHPLQEAFIQKGAVQCGYCTPGFLMSAKKLLEERPQPSHNDILWGLSGNLCRCTGYYKIIEAIEEAVATMDTAV
jgi:xanthine dehydrogenase iron-sulfur cluster and FAD-binding subunit A